MEYANKRAFPFVAIIGEAERDANKVKLKDMKSGNEELVDVNELISKLKIN